MCYSDALSHDFIIGIKKLIPLVINSLYIYIVYKARCIFFLTKNVREDLLLQKKIRYYD